MAVELHLPPAAESDEFFAHGGVAKAPLASNAGGLRSAAERLEAAFGSPFALVDARAGELVGGAMGRLPWDLPSRMEVLAEAAGRRRPEIVENESPLVMLAIPLAGLERGGSLVAVGVFTTTRVDCEAEIAAAARVFGVDAASAFAWAKQAEPWPTRHLLRLAEATIENLVQGSRLEYLQQEINEAVAHARDTYAELGLLHRLTRRLTLSQDDGQLWRRSVQWLAESVPATCLAIVPRSAVDAEHAGGAGATEVIYGQCPVRPRDLAEIIARLGAAAHRPLLLSRHHTSAVTWGFPTVRELACTPILDGSAIEGWLLAVNHTGGDAGGLCEFGSAEVRLLESVSTILGVHRSNTGLFHRQADLFSAAVRALTSAIDAKDQYTHGHSERVARVSVCLAEQLRLAKGDVNTIYLGGLLHDIGKIGVDDQVLNKPGQLTPEEFAQIKQHPQLGYDILCGMKQLDRILPIVLHHHEAWDGSGYPHGLEREETPLLARVAAVADAFDAMSSDRPYRLGMPDAKIDAIFREGAGRQWDPTVVDAFFSVRDQVSQASRDAAFDAIPLDATAWVH
jgi:putative nucleotidyltransferase with HDIG domain